MNRFLALIVSLAMLRPADVSADGGHPQWFGPIPPDPLMTNRVPCPHSAASLALRQMIDPTGLFAWEFLKETESLNTAQLRTLVHDLLRPRRYYHEIPAADQIAIQAWAARDLAAATADILNIPDWEDRDMFIDDYDSDVEYEGWVLWSRLAETDFAKAVRIADRLQGHETQRMCFSVFGDQPLFQPSQIPALVRLARRHRPYAEPEEIAGDAVCAIFQRTGRAAAQEAIRKLPAGPEKQEAAERFAEWQDPGSKIWTPAVFKNPALTKLAALDCQEQHCRSLPVPLLRAVVKLSPEEALALGTELKAAPPPRSATPIGWAGCSLCAPRRVIRTGR